MATDMSRYDIDEIFHSLGMAPPAQQRSPIGIGGSIGGGSLGGISGGPLTPQSQGPSLTAGHFEGPGVEREQIPIGAMGQFAYGVASPILALARRSHEAPKPQNVIETIANIGGSILGWGIPIALTGGIGTGAAVGLGLTSKAAMAKGVAPFAATAVKGGVSFGITNAIREWGNKESTLEDITKSAAQGAVLGGLIFPGIGAGWKHPATRKAIYRMKESTKGLIGRPTDKSILSDTGLMDTLQQAVPAQDDWTRRGLGRVAKSLYDEGKNIKDIIPGFANLSRSEQYAAVVGLAKQVKPGDYGSMYPFRHIFQHGHQVLDTSKKLGFVNEQGLLAGTIRDPEGLRKLKTLMGTYKPQEASKEIHTTALKGFNFRESLKKDTFVARGPHTDWRTGGSRVYNQLREPSPIKWNYRSPDEAYQGLTSRSSFGRLTIQWLDGNLDTLDKAPLGKQLEIITRQLRRAGVMANKAAKDMGLDPVKMINNGEYRRRSLEGIHAKIKQNQGSTSEWSKQLRKAYNRFVNSTEYFDDLDTIRNQLTPSVAEAMDMGARGMLKHPAFEYIMGPVLKWYEDGTIDQMTGKQFMAKMKHDVLRQSGVKRISDLPQIQQDQYRTIQEAVESLGMDKVVMERMGMMTGLPMKEAKALMDGFTALPSIKALGMTTADAWELSSDPKGIFNIALFRGMRRVMGEPAARVVRNAKYMRDRTNQAYSEKKNEILRSIDKIDDPKEKQKAYDFLYRFITGEIKRAPGKRDWKASTVKVLDSRYVNAKGEYVTREAYFPAEWVDTAQKMDVLFGNVGRALGLSSDRMLKNYLPKIRAAGGIDAANIKFAKGEREIVEWIADFARTDQIYVQERNIHNLFNAYVRGGTALKYYKPMDETIYNMFSQLGLATKDETVQGMQFTPAGQSKWNYWQGLRNYLMNPQMGPTEAAINNALTGVAKTMHNAMIQKGLKPDTPFLPGSNYTQTIASFIVHLQNAGALAGNAYSAGRNLTQQLLSVTHIDKNPLVGLEYWYKAKMLAKTPVGKKLLEANAVLSGRVAHEGLAAEFNVTNTLSFGDLRKESRTMRELYDWSINKGMSMFRAADRNNVNTSWLMQFLKSTDQGYDFRLASEHAYAFTMSTQFMYGIDSPALYRNPLGKVIGTFSSWPMNYVDLLREQGSTAPIKMASTILAGIAGSEMLSQTGLSFRSMHPVETAKGFFPLMMLGDDNRPHILETAQHVPKMLLALASGDGQRISDEFSAGARRFSTMVPFGVPSRRVLDVGKAAAHDWKVLDNKKRIRHEYDTDNLLYNMTGVPPEALIRMIGPAQKDAERWRELQAVELQDSQYRRIRWLAINAFLDGDLDRFVRMQTELGTIGENEMVSASDIEQEIRLRSTDPISRRSRTLPEPIRDRVKATSQFWREEEEESLYSTR